MGPWALHGGIDVGSAGRVNVPASTPAVLQFLGAAGTVTGSRFLVDTGGSRVLVDCGMFQGRRDIRERNWMPFPVPPESIDAVVLTHAHLDHTGYLPALVRDGFAGPVFATRATAQLASIILRDSARLQEEEASYVNRKRYSRHRPALALYTSEDAEKAEKAFRIVEFGATVEVAAGIAAVLLPAGHILGSSIVELRLPEVNVLFTGDLGRKAHPLLTPPADPPDADIVVTESTYGDRLHDDESEEMETLATAISQTAERGGTIVIPAFAVDRTEVVLHALGRLAADGRIPRLPIHADSPMALAVLDVYRDAIRHGDPGVLPLSEDVFDVGGELREVSTTAGSRDLNMINYPSIILSASGMATGGRVLHHLANRLPDSKNTVILAGFQAPGTRGFDLAQGARSVKIFGKYVPVRADVVVLDSFSVHADADELVGWLGRMDQRPDVAFIVHGEQAASEALAVRLTDELDWTAIVPADREQVRIT